MQLKIRKKSKKMQLKDKKNKLKTIEKDETVYLEDNIDKLFEMYSKSFTGQGKKLLKILAKNEDKINYKNFKTLFPNSTFHIINLLKKYVTLFSLLEVLVTRKMTVNNENVDQICFIINVMHEYDEGKLYGIKELKSECFHNTTLKKTRDFF